jgi:hypothetical protein
VEKFLTFEDSPRLCCGESSIAFLFVEEGREKRREERRCWMALNCVQGEEEVGRGEG